MERRPTGINCYGRTRNGSAARIQRSKPATLKLFIFIWCHCEPALAWFMWCELRHGLYFIILRAVMTRGPTALITGRGSKFVVESSSSSVWCGFRAFASQSHSAGNALSAPSAVIRFILKAVNVSSPSTEIYWKKCKKSVRRRCWFSLLLSRTRGETVMSLMVFKYKILRNIQFLLQLNGIVPLAI